MASNSNISSIGRFSSQMLTNLGTQRTVKSVNGSTVNTYKYNTGNVAYPDPGSAQQSAYGDGVVGSYSPADYNSTKCYYLSRGVGNLYADTMTALTLDMATMLGVSVQSLIEQMSVNGQLMFTPDAYRAMNALRDPGNQTAVVTSVDNKFSLQSREIRS